MQACSSSTQVIPEDLVAVFNPLYQRYEIEGLLIHSSERFNRRICALAVKALQLCDLPVPTSERLSYRVLRLLSSHGKCEQAKSQSRIQKMSRKCQTHLLSSGTMLEMVRVRAKFIADAIAQMAFVRKRSTKLIEGIKERLNAFRTWSPIQHDTGRIEKAAFAHFHRLMNLGDVKDPKIRDFLIEGVYGNREHFEAFNTSVEAFCRSARTLIPFVQYLIQQSRAAAGIDRACLEGVSFPVDLPPGFLDNIEVAQLFRSYYPSEAVPFESLQVNRQYLDIQSYRGGEQRKQFFIDLASKVNSFAFSGKMVSFHGLQSYVEEDVDFLFSGKGSESQLLKLLAAGTIEAWSPGDRMIRLLFAGLNSAPFRMKTAQGIQLEIAKKRLMSSKVSQIKQYAIHVRTNPYDPGSLSCQPQPVCILTFKWSIFSQVKSEMVKRRGTLTIQHIQMTPEATPLEVREIERCLANPEPLPESWFRAPLTEVERKLPRL